MRFRHGTHARKSHIGRKVRLALVPATGVMAIGALGPVFVHPGDTLSGIASSNGVSLSSIERANPQLTNPDLIYAGQKINLPGGSGSTVGGSPNHHRHHQPAAVPPPSHAAGTGSASSGDLADVPGVPRAFAQCVAFRESGNNPQSVNAVPGFIGMGGGAYGIMDYIWQGADLNKSGQPYDAPLSEQKAAFSTLYAKYGSQPWTPSDGC